VVAVGVTLHLALLKTLKLENPPSKQEICKGGESQL